MNPRQSVRPLIQSYLDKSDPAYACELPYDRIALFGQCIGKPTDMIPVMRELPRRDTVRQVAPKMVYLFSKLYKPNIVSIWTGIEPSWLPHLERLGVQISKNVVIDKFEDGLLRCEPIDEPLKRKIVPWYLKRIGVQPLATVVPLTPNEIDQKSAPAAPLNVSVFLLDDGVVQHDRLTLAEELDLVTCPQDTPQGTTPQKSACLQQGTLVAGIIGAHDKIDTGVAGVCPGVRIQSIKVVENQRTSVFNILMALDTIAARETGKSVIHFGFAIDGQLATTVPCLQYGHST
jgi:hypothetical protein